jgi:hypothetical protein
MPEGYCNFGWGAGWFIGTPSNLAKAQGKQGKAINQLRKAHGMKFPTLYKIYGTHIQPIPGMWDLRQEFST